MAGLIRHILPCVGSKHHKPCVGELCLHLYAPLSSSSASVQVEVEVDLDRGQAEGRHLRRPGCDAARVPVFQRVEDIEGLRGPVEEGFADVALVYWRMQP